MNSKTMWTPGPWRDGCGPDGKPLIFTTSTAFPRVDADYEHRANMHLLDSAPRLYEALEAFLESYLSLVNSGDCGNWDPETEAEVKEARAALAAARGEASS